MNMRTIWLVYCKELLETLRDKRTLIVMIMLPLCLYPLLAIVLTQWVSVHEDARQKEVSKVGITEAARKWKELEQVLLENKKIDLITANEESSLKQKKIDLLIRVSLEYEKALKVGESITIELLFDETQDNSNLAQKRVREILSDFSKELVAEKLAHQALPLNFAHPLILSDKSIATSKQRGAHLLADTLSILIILMVLLGAFYPAIDLTAGEKERGTLETLLTVPVPRLSLIIGKSLVVCTIATATGLLNLGSIGITIGWGLKPILEKIDFASSIPWSAIALTAVAILPTALFFSALMVAIAALARTFKEAQNILTPVYMVCMIPALLIQLPGTKLNIITALIPAINVALLTKEMINQEATLGLSLLALISTCFYALIALNMAARVYNSERLLFAPDSPKKHRINKRNSQTETADPLYAGFLLLGVMALFVLVGQPLQANNLVSGIIITEWALIALPVFLLIRYANLSLRKILSLEPSKPVAYIGAAIAGLSGWYLVSILVQTIQEHFLPIPPDLANQMQSLIFSKDRNLLLDLFALAISPAICEELLFRGVLLRSGSKTLKPSTLIIINAILFGLFHLSIYRFFSTAILGAVLATIVIRTGSIFPAMVFHFFNNATTIVIGRLVIDNAGNIDEVPLNPIHIITALLIFAGGLVLVLRKTPLKSTSTP